MGAGLRQLGLGCVVVVVVMGGGGGDVYQSQSLTRQCYRTTTLV